MGVWSVSRQRREIRSQVLTQLGKSKKSSVWVAPGEGCRASCNTHTHTKADTHTHTAPIASWVRESRTRGTVDTLITLMVTLSYTP